jgi:PEP-CTERM motif
MKKYSVALIFILMLAIAVPVGAASYIIGGAYGNGGYTSPYAGATVETFDPNGVSNLGWSFSDSNYAIRLGSVSDAAAPWYDTAGGQRDLTYYLTVPVSTSVSPVSVTIGFGGATYNYFGLWWGSMDTYNTLEFLRGGVVVDTVLGTTFSDGSGAQDAAKTNKYVNFYGMPNFDAVRLTSTNYAFEVDNLAVGNNLVPEPLTMVLLGSGLLGLFGLRRKLS